MNVINVFLKMAVTVRYRKKINLLLNVDMAFGKDAERDDFIGVLVK